MKPTAADRALVREFSRRLRHLERQLTPFMCMSKEELVQMHPVFPIANWKMLVVLTEAAGYTTHDLAEVLP